MKKTIFFVLAWLLLINVFALLVSNRFNLKTDTAYAWIDSTKTPQVQSWNPIPLHSKWDSVYYTDIAQNGYHLISGDTLSNVVFFPLYPLLIRTVSPIAGSGYIFAGWVVSMLALIGAVVVFYKLLKEFHPKIDSLLPIFYLLIFPTAFFLTSVYTESLFLFLSLLTFYYALKKDFKLAGIFGLLTSLTRITGILLFIPVFWEFYKKHGVRKIFSFSFLTTLLIPLGTFLFFLYHYFRFGDFLLFFKVESAWGRSFQLNTSQFLFFSHPSLVNFLLDVGFSIFALCATYLAFKKKWTSYGLYMLATIGVALSTGTFMSIGRYILVLFPIYIVLASIKNAYFEKIYTMGSLLLFAMNIILFVNWYWAG